MARVFVWTAIGLFGVASALCVAFPAEARTALAMAGDFLPPVLAPNPKPSPAPARPITALVVGYGEIDVDGGIVPLTLPTIGQVKEILVHDGQTVTKGQPLVRLDAEVAVLQIAQAKFAVQEAEIQLERALLAPQNHALSVTQQQQAVEVAKSRLDTQQRLVDRLSRLHQADALAEENVDTAKNRIEEFQSLVRVETAKLQQLALEDPARTIRMAQAALSSARSQLATAQEQFDRFTLSAPTDGVVLRVLVGPGQSLSVAQRQPMLWFCPDKPWIVRCEIEQEFADRVSVGMKGKVFNDSLEGPSWSAQVQRTAEWVAHRRNFVEEPMQLVDSPTVECILVLDPKQTSLRIGQRVRVEIEPTEKPNVEDGATHNVATLPTPAAPVRERRLAN